MLLALNSTDPPAERDGIYPGVPSSRRTIRYRSCGCRCLTLMAWWPGRASTATLPARPRLLQPGRGPRGGRVVRLVIQHFQRGWSRAVSPEVAGNHSQLGKVAAGHHQL